MTTFGQILHYMRKSMGFAQPVNSHMFDSSTPNSSIRLFCKLSQLVYFKQEYCEV